MVPRLGKDTCLQYDLVLQSLFAKITNIMEAKVKSVSAFPNPQPFDVQKRIQELRGYLDPKNPDHQPEEQHTNIKAAIKI